MFRRYSWIMVFSFIVHALAYGADTNSEQLLNQNHKKFIQADLDNDFEWDAQISSISELLNAVKIRLTKKQNFAVSIKDEGFLLEKNIFSTQFHIYSPSWNENIVQLLEAVDDKTTISIHIHSADILDIDKTMIHLLMKKDWQEIFFFAPTIFVNPGIMNDLELKQTYLTLNSDMFHLRKIKAANLIQFRIYANTWNNNIDNIVKSLALETPYSLILTDANGINIDSALINTVMEKNCHEFSVRGKYSIAGETLTTLTKVAPWTNINLNETDCRFSKNISGKLPYISYRKKSEVSNNLLFEAAASSQLGSIFIEGLVPVEIILALREKYKFVDILIPEAAKNVYQDLVAKFPRILFVSGNAIKLFRPEGGALNRSDNSDSLAKKIELITWNETIAEKLLALPNLEEVNITIEGQPTEGFIEIARAKKIVRGSITSTFTHPMNHSFTERIYFGKVNELLLTLMDTQGVDFDKDALRNHKEAISFVDTDVTDDIFLALKEYPSLCKLDLTGSTGITLNGIGQLWENNNLNEIVLPKEFFDRSHYDSDESYVSFIEQLKNLRSLFTGVKFSIAN